jgi:hypothetical protein
MKNNFCTRAIPVLDEKCAAIFIFTNTVDDKAWLLPDVLGTTTANFGSVASNPEIIYVYVEQMLR